MPSLFQLIQQADPNVQAVADDFPHAVPLPNGYSEDTVYKDLKKYGTFGKDWFGIQSGDGDSDIVKFRDPSHAMHFQLSR